MTGPSSVSSKVRKYSAPALATLLILLVEGWSRQPPERLAVVKTVAVDARDAVPDSGHAYWISLRWIAPAPISDQDGASQIALLENGVELEGHALHADVRERGGGLYSHWGAAILFSTRDGSDPRTNGHRYEVRLPPAIPIWHRWAQAGLLGAAILLLLIWLHGTLGGSLLRTGLWACGGTVALVIVALSSAFASSPARELRAVREAVTESSAGGLGREDAGAGQPRTRHLLRDANAVAFATTAPAPAAHRPRLIALRPTGGAARDDGFVELGDGSALRNVEALDVAASDLELMVLELEVARGGSLVLRLSALDDPGAIRNTALLSIPVSASPKPQTFHFRRPALGATDRVRQVALQAGPATGEPPIVRVESLRYTLRLDAFAAAHSGFDSVELAGSLRPALWQSVVGRSSLPLPEGGSLLKLAVGALAESPGSLDFVVSVVHQDGRRSVLERGSVDSRDGWRELALTLPEDARELLLEGDRLPSRSALLWSGARVIDRQRSPRRMVLILADTLRADALGCYGHPGDPTPALDRLAGQGARFERAFSQTYWTRPSMASIMTGHYVAATGVETLDHRLPDAYETLAERLADGGFTTVGLLTNTNAGPAAGLDQGFDRIRLSRSLTRQQQDQTRRLVAEVVLPTLDQLDDDDVFLYLHLMEAHGPYGPSEPPEPGSWLPEGGPPVARDSVLDRPWNQRPTAAQRVALYHYDVRSMDRALGELFAQLDRRWGAPGGAPPILAFVSDHGEHLGERDQWGHRFADLYPENVQVPMIIRAPGRIGPGIEVSEPVEVRHLGATLLDLANLVPGRDAGTSRSLLPLLGAVGDAAARPIFAVSAGKDQDRAVFSLFGRRYGYVARFVQDAPRIAIFSDSGLERRIISPWRLPMLERGFLGVHSSYLESQGKIHQRLWVGLDDAPRMIDPEELKRLKALGYIED